MHRSPTPGPDAWTPMPPPLRRGAYDLLVVPALGSTDEHGLLLHEDDMAAQLARALENVEHAVAEAGLGPADLALLRLSTTDVPELRAVLDVAHERFAELGVDPPVTVVEVRGLALPGMTVAIEALAVRSTPTPTPEEEA